MINYFRNLVNKRPAFFYGIAVLLIWTAFLTASVLWNIFHEWKDAERLAAVEAHASFDRNLTFRRWAAVHGGVYVPVSDRTRPSPYLSGIKERDIITVSGKRLTLMNPAYMMRQMNEIYTMEVGSRIMGHITSLSPLRPENAPDQWEAAALRAFETGKKEVSAVVDIKGNQFFRLIRPVVTEQDCLKCHASQGYKLGDVRGGISVSVPIKNFRVHAENNIVWIVLWHSGIWLAGFVGIGLSVRHYDRYSEDRRWTEDSLRLSEQKYRNLVESARDAIFMADAESGVIIDANRQAEVLTGRSKQELIGMHQSELHLPEEAEKHRALFAELVCKGSGLIRDVTVRHKLGHDIPVDISSSVADINGVKIIHGIFQDITEQKRSTDALVESEEKFRTYADFTYDWETWMGQDGKYIYVSPSCERITGYSAKEFMERPILFLEIVRSDFRAIIEAHHFDQEFTVDMKELEFCIITKGGEERWISHAYQAVYDSNGKWLGRRASNRDVTDLRRTQEQQLHLEHQLMQAQKIESVGQLAGGIAHDFNNILTAITGDAYIAMMKLEENSPVRSYIKDIISSSEKAADLTRSLLAFSRKQLIKPRPILLNSVVSDMERLTARLIGEDIIFRTELSSPGPVVFVDRSQIEQVLINLITNARDAMLRGGRITVSTDTVLLDEQFLREYGYGEQGLYGSFSVTDTGTGIDEGTAKKIYEPFFTTKEVGKGTGLGLSIVYGIVKQHDGYITCNSRLGQGTTFSVYLPLAEARPDDFKKGETVVFKGDGETILIAEDDQAVRKMISELIEFFGYTVIEAIDGEDAVTKYRENAGKIGLVITDVVMPGKNGREAVEEIKKINPEVRVLFTSGYTADIIHQKGIFDEQIDFLEKPIVPFTLISRIRDILDGKA